MELKGTILPLMVLVKDHEKESKTETGIIIPDVAETPTMKGTVVCVGESTSRIPMVIRKNKTVLFHNHAGNKIRIEGEEYRLMRQNDIFFQYE